jgi:hypothetical protein
MHTYADRRKNGRSRSTLILTMASFMKSKVAFMPSANPAAVCHHTTHHSSIKSSRGLQVLARWRSTRCCLEVWVSLILCKVKID